MRGRAIRTLVVASALVLCAACGGDEPGARTPTPTGSGTTPPATTIPTDTPTTAGNAIDVLDNQYQPAALTVPVGTAVVWTHKGTGVHSVTARDGSFDSNPQCPADLSACMKTGDVFRFTFTRAGEFGYRCKIHGDLMTGVIVVQ